MTTKEGSIMKVLIVFYSTYGHIFKMAEAVAEGAKEVAGAEVHIRRVPETLPEEVLEKMGAVEAQKAFSHIPVCTVDELAASRCNHIRHAYSFWQYVRANAPISGRYRAACGPMVLWSAKWEVSLPAAPPSTAARNLQFSLFM